MNPSWVVMAGGSSLSVSPPQRKVSVLAAVAGLAAGQRLARPPGRPVAQPGPSWRRALPWAGRPAAQLSAAEQEPERRPRAAQRPRSVLQAAGSCVDSSASMTSWLVLLGCPSIVLDLQDSTAAAGSHAPLTPLPQPSPSRGEGWGEGREGSPEGDGILLSDSDASHQPVLLDGGTCDQE